MSNALLYSLVENHPVTMILHSADYIMRDGGAPDGLRLVGSLDGHPRHLAYEILTPPGAGLELLRNGCTVRGARFVLPEIGARWVIEKCKFGKLVPTRYIIRPASSARAQVPTSAVTFPSTSAA